MKSFLNWYQIEDVSNDINISNANMKCFLIDSFLTDTKADIFEMV